MAKETIGFIGVGHMGQPMASRLIAAGHPVVAYDIQGQALSAIANKGAVTAASPAEVASRAEIVMTSLPMPAVVEEVVLGERGIAAGSRVKTFVDLSTTGPRVAKSIAAALLERGITAIDAPVSGGVAGAVKGTLAVMTSGPKEDCERLRPTLEAIGKFFYIGPEPGMGQMMKLINNLLSATATAATSEAMVLGVKAGLDPKVMIDVINAGSGRSTASEDKFPRAILPRTVRLRICAWADGEGRKTLHRRGRSSGRADVDRPSGQAGLAIRLGAGWPGAGFYRDHPTYGEVVGCDRKAALENTAPVSCTLRAADNACGAIEL